MTDKLKPCPFCGGKAEIHNCMEFENDTLALIYSGKSGVHCSECHCATIPYGSKDEAIEVWNRRADNDR